MSDEVRLARAYLSRVAEPCCLPLWDLVQRAGPVAAAAAVRAGTVEHAVARATDARRLVADPEADLDAAERRGIRLLSPESPEWPHFAFGALDHAARRALASQRPAATPGLDTIDPVPPLALWVRGSADLTSAAVRSVAVVGARAATAYGSSVADGFAHDLAARGVEIVSGGAFGIDAAAHRGALAAGGTTLLVSAGGVDQAYPAAHQSLFERVAASGLVLSESPPGSRPHRLRFLVRNRLIAALGSATVVVEAALRSGARSTAGHARRLGRPVLIVPGPVTSAQSAGCHMLLRDFPEDTLLVASVEHILQVLGSDADPPAPDARDNGDNRDAGIAGRGTHGADAGTSDRRVLLDGMDEASRRVYDGLPARRSVRLSDLVVTSGLPVPAVLRAVPALELAGLIRTDADGAISRAPERRAGAGARRGPAGTG